MSGIRPACARSRASCKARFRSHRHKLNQWRRPSGSARSWPSTGAARSPRGPGVRNLSQPAASQQLRALERATGSPLFVRTPHGVEPTRPGRELYVGVADALDRLEPLLAGLDGGRSDRRRGPALRLVARVLHLRTWSPAPPRGGPLTVRFGTDAELLGLLQRGELDVVVTTGDPGRRGLAGRPLGVTRFVLVAAPGTGPRGRRHRPSSGGSWPVPPGSPTAPSCRVPVGSGRRPWDDRSPATSGWWPRTSGRGRRRGPRPRDQPAARVRVRPRAWPAVPWSRCTRWPTSSRRRPGSPRPATPTSSGPRSPGSSRISGFREPPDRHAPATPATGRPSSR